MSKRIGHKKRIKKEKVVGAESESQNIHFFFVSFFVATQLPSA
jgi:hypothetical protein